MSRMWSQVLCAAQKQCRLLSAHHTTVAAVRLIRNRFWCRMGLACSNRSAQLQNTVRSKVTSSETAPTKDPYYFGKEGSSATLEELLASDLSMEELVRGEAGTRQGPNVASDVNEAVVSMRAFFVGQKLDTTAFSADMATYFPLYAQIQGRHNVIFSLDEATADQPEVG